ncbi:MAG: DUF2516 family protein [Actinocatenispora sp.]
MEPPLALDLVSPVTHYVGLIVTVFALVLELFAFVHCAFQRGDAFKAVGTLPKGVWLAITGGAAALTLLLGIGPVSLLALIGVIAGAVYTLDVRPALKDATNGNGPW